MGAIKIPPPAKLVCGVLFNPAVEWAFVEDALAADFGEIDLHSPTWPFDFTDYYDHETGPGVQRTFVAFERLVAMDALPDIKRRTNEIEAELARRLDVPAPRPVNLDPGYVDAAKLVLATTKDQAHRIYLRDGLYAEVTLTFRGGRFEAWPWTYLDYASGRYHEFFGQVRGRYFEQTRGSCRA